MEAMAFGFPIVINRPRWEKEPEVSGVCAIVVKGTESGFRKAFQGFLDDPSSVESRGAISRQRIQEYSGESMESKECDLITKLIAAKKR